MSKGKVSGCLLGGVINWYVGSYTQCTALYYIYIYIFNIYIYIHRGKESIPNKLYWEWERNWFRLWLLLPSFQINIRHRLCGTCRFLAERMKVVVCVRLSLRVHSESERGHSKIRDAVKLLGDERVLDGHVTRVIVKGRSGEQDDEWADHRGDGVQPEEEPIQHHGDKSPVFVLLLLKKN